MPCKIKAAKSPLKEADGVPTNPEQEEGDAIPRAGSWGEILELQRTQNTKSRSVAVNSTFWLQITKCNLIAAISAPKQQ